MSGQLVAPPCNLEAEQSLLGCCLIDRDAIARVSGLVEPFDFYRAAHADIFGAMTALASRDGSFDLVTVADELSSRSRLDSCGGRAYLLELTTLVATSANVVNYANLVRRDAVLRKVLEVSSDIAGLAVAPGADSEKILAHVSATLLPVLSRNTATTVVDATEASSRYLDSIGDERDDPEKTGFRAVDAVFQGFRKGEFTVVAARPAVGKSQMLLNLLVSMCRRRKRVLFLSLEMSVQEMMDRLVAQISRVPINRVRLGKVESDRAPIATAIGEIASWKENLLMDDNPRLTPDTLDSKCRTAKERMGGLDFVFVDYLGLMESPGKGETWEKVGNISRRMKIAAKEMRVSMIAAHQLNREAEKGNDSKPYLHHLANSSSVERDTDHVFLLYRPAADPHKKYEELCLDDRITAEVTIAKNRHGATGVAKLRFDGETSRFMDF